MARRWYSILLIICLLPLFVQLGWILISSQAGTEGWSSELPGPLIVFSFLGIIGWILGIIDAAKNRHWVWLVVIIVLNQLAAGIYALVQLVKDSPIEE